MRASRGGINHGKGEHGIRLAPEQAPSDASRRLLALFQSPAYEPPKLPRVAIELLELSRRSDVDTAHVAALIEKDPMLAAKVLSYAQSPAYATSMPLRSLQQALARLGLRTVADMVLEASMNMTVFRARGFEEPMEKLRRHSTATAYIARIIGRYTPHDDDYAFLCGLMHDVGLVAAMIALAPGRREGKVPGYDVLAPTLVAVHEEASGLLAKHWKLPVEVQWVLGHHHHVQIQGRPHPIAAVVALADNLAARFGFGDDHRTKPEILRMARKTLGLEGAVVPLILELAEEAVAGLK
jgi:HD-like signal output (HDOD) protein